MPRLEYRRLADDAGADAAAGLEHDVDVGRDHVVVQRFIERVSSEGDRRVIVLDGEPIGVVRRVATGREFRCNMATGAAVVADVVTPRDKEICHRMAPDLARHGLVACG